MAMTPNILHKYPSWTYNLALYPVPYGGFPGAANSVGAYEFPPKKDLNLKKLRPIIASGYKSAAINLTPEYGPNFYFDRLSFKNTVSNNANSKMANTTIFTFSIIETFGVSLFDRLMKTGQKNGYKVNPATTPYALAIEFYAIDETTGAPVAEICKPKVMYLKLGEITTKITTRGAEYQVQAQPYSQDTLAESAAVLPIAVSIEAATVNEFFGSYHKLLNDGNPDYSNVSDYQKTLSAALTKWQDKAVKDRTINKPNEYIFYFHPDIGNSKLLDADLIPHTMLANTVVKNTVPAPPAKSSTAGTSAVGGLTNSVTGAVGGLTNSVTGAVGGLTNSVTGAVGGLTNSVTGAVGGLTNSVTGAVGGLTNSVTGGLATALGELTGSASTLLAQAGGNLSSAQSLLSGLSHSTSDSGSSNAATLQALTGAAIADTSSPTSAALKAAVDSLLQKEDALAGKMETFINGALSTESQKISEYYLTAVNPAIKAKGTSHRTDFDSEKSDALAAINEVKSQTSNSGKSVELNDALNIMSRAKSLISDLYLGELQLLVSSTMLVQLLDESTSIDEQFRALIDESITLNEESIRIAEGVIDTTEDKLAEAAAKGDTINNQPVSVTDQLTATTIVSNASAPTAITTGKAATVATVTTSTTRQTPVPPATSQAATFAVGPKKGVCNAQTKAWTATDNVSTTSGKILWQFNQGTAISDVISMVVCSSEYIRKQFTEPTHGESSKKNEPNLTSPKAIDWFKILPIVANLDPDDSMGSMSKRYEYTIDKYRIYQTKIPTAPMSCAPEPQKEYNYIYTGKNKDVLNFDLNFANLYKTYYAHSGVAVSSSMAATKKAHVEQPTLTDETTDVRSKVRDINSTSTPATALAGTTSTHKGMPSIDAKGQTIADFYKTQLERSVDLLSVDLKIVGDPDFIKQDDIRYQSFWSEHGTDGKYSQKGEFEGIKYDAGSVFVKVNFNTITDYSETGIASTNAACSFSGYYNILEVEHSFQGGRFEQTLKLVRHGIQETKIDPDVVKNKT